MLVAEVEAAAECERAVRAAELPEDAAVGAGDFVDYAGVPSRYQVIAIGVLVDRVDVEVVPWLICSETCARRFGAVW